MLDSQPGTVPIDVDAPTSVGKIIQLIHSIPTPLSNRQELYRCVVGGAQVSGLLRLWPRQQAYAGTLIDVSIHSLHIM